MISVLAKQSDGLMSWSKDTSPTGNSDKHVIGKETTNGLHGKK